MKTKLTVSATIVSLMGVSGVALAETGTQFTPVEKLMPDQRQLVFERLSQMTNGAELDWDRIIVGVNEEGQIVIFQKDEIKSKSIGTPSSFGRSAIEPSMLGMAETGDPSSFGMAVKTESVE